MELIRYICCSSEYSFLSSVPDKASKQHQAGVKSTLNTQIPLPIKTANPSLGAGIFQYMHKTFLLCQKATKVLMFLWSY